MTDTEMTNAEPHATLSIPGVPKVIGPAHHAALDYGVVATYLVLAARFWSSHRRAASLALINGGMVLGVSLLTDYPGGLWRRIPFPMHGRLDLVQAATAGFGPMLLGFAGDAEATTFYGQAVSELGVVAATDWDARQ
jgi:hypothetical protein